MVGSVAGRRLGASVNAISIDGDSTLRGEVPVLGRRRRNVARAHRGPPMPSQGHGKGRGVEIVERAPSQLAEVDSRASTHVPQRARTNCTGEHMKVEQRPRRSGSRIKPAPATSFFASRPLIERLLGVPSILGEADQRAVEVGVALA